MSNNNVESPSLKFYQSLEQAFDFYNKELFEGKLNKVFFTVRSGENKDKKTQILGYYWQNIFAYQKKPISEIALNISTFGDCSTVEVLAVLVHEMTHQWRAEVSSEPYDPNRLGGHDEIWGNKMQQMGLVPTNTGIPGGKRTGKQMMHYIADDGLFQQKTLELIKAGFVIPIFDGYGAASKYTIKIAPTNNVLVEKWMEEAKTEDEKELIELSVNSMSENPNIVRADIRDLHVPIRKPPKPKKVSLKYHCPSCDKKISGPEDLYILCMDCDEVYTLVQKFK